MTRLSFRSFQSTLPRRERHISTTSKYPFGYFNPRSREGSDARVTRRGRVGGAISIHAPAKGATTNTSHTNGTTRHISIHAPAKGATDHQTVSQTKPIISIHAPAKGATSRIMSIASTVSIFQSTLPRRERRGRSAHCGTSSTFQSTLPRRERRSAGLAPAFSSMHFNPRSREGSDVAGRPIAASEPFQSTLPRRERRASSAVMGKAAAFQSTLPRRERPDR